MVLWEQIKKSSISFLTISFIFLLYHQSIASLFKNTVPTGKEINDPYLQNLFAPDFPYESVKVIEKQNGERVVAVKAKKKVSDDMFKQYYKTLENRGISVENDWDTKHGILMSAKVLFGRELSKKPYVIEYSEAYHEAENLTVGLPHNIAWKVGHYIVYWIDRDFGKKFKKITIYTNDDSPCPMPPLVGKYPQSKSVCCYRMEHIEENLNKEIKRSNKIVFLFVTRDSPEKIRDYYQEKLIKQFKAHRMLGLEKYNWSVELAGVKIKDYGVDISWLEWEIEHNRTKDYGILNRLDKIIWEDLKQEKGKYIIPDGGEVFKVEIYKGSDNWTKGFNWIKVYYETDREEIQKIIKIYSEIDKWKPN